MSLDPIFQVPVGVAVTYQVPAAHCLTVQGRKWEDYSRICYHSGGPKRLLATGMSETAKRSTDTSVTSLIAP